MAAKCKNGYAKCQGECGEELEIKENYTFSESGKTRRKICKKCWPIYTESKKGNNPSSLIEITRKMNRKNPNYKGRITKDPLQGLSEAEIQRRRDKAYAQYCTKKGKKTKLGFGDMFPVQEEHDEEFAMPSIMVGMR